jgi:hypothetical protein
VARATTQPVPTPRPIPARPRRAHWQALLATWRRSGLSQAEFCRRHELAPGTFAWWKHTLRREAAAQGGAKRPAPARTVVAPAFVPVRVVAAPPTPPRPSAPADAVLEIVLARGRLVRVRGRVDAPWLAAVVAALETPAC